MTVPLKDYTLFTPYQLSKSLELKNRIVLSQLTRARCDPVTHEAGPMQVEYYSQRAGAGLIHHGSGRRVGARVRMVRSSVHVHGGPPRVVASGCRERTDKYGGSIENRARFLIELVEALQSEWAADRIGLRLSPNGFYGDTGSADNYEMCCYVAKQLSKYGLAYLATLDGFGFGFQDKGRLTKPFDVKKNFEGTVIAANSYTRDTAEGVLRSGAADLVSFGRPYISNPDLAERFYNDWPLNEPAGYDTWFGTRMPGPRGYIDFPVYKN